jgi:hypothetical protein
MLYINRNRKGTVTYWLTCDCGFDGLVSEGFVSLECDEYHMTCQCCGAEHITHSEDATCEG